MLLDAAHDCALDAAADQWNPHLELADRDAPSAVTERLEGDVVRRLKSLGVMVGQDAVPGGMRREVEAHVVDPGELGRVDHASHRRRQLRREAIPDTLVDAIAVALLLEQLGVTELRELRRGGDERAIQERALDLRQLRRDALLDAESDASVSRVPGTLSRQ